MNFPYSTYTCTTTHRPQNYHTAHPVSIKPSFNEDAHCDNEVNLILDKNCNQPSSEQFKGKLSCNEQASPIGNQTHQYYFMPIREQNLTATAILTGNNVTDSASLLLSSSDFQHPSILNLFDDSLANFFPSSTLEMNSADTTTVNKSNNNHNSLTDADLAALFLSSIASASPSSTLNGLADTLSNHSHETSNPNLDDVFLSQLTDLTCSSPSSSSSALDTQPQPLPVQSLGPPPGFENFLRDASSTSDLLLSQTTNNNSTLSSVGSAGMQTPVSSSDTINFSQLFASAAADAQQQQPMVNNSGKVRLSSSSHSSFASDEQSIFFPLSTHHPYPSSSSSSILHSTSQMFSTNTTSSAATTIHSAAKLQIPNSLSLNNNNNNNNNSNQFSSSSSASFLTSSTRDSPITITTIENDKRIADGGMAPNHIFASTNSFFSNGHAEFHPSKPAVNKAAPSKQPSSLATRTSTSSASSSTSSSIDEALIQLSHQQQQLSNVNKLFTDEPSSIFHSSSAATQAKPNLDEEQQAMHDNISFLASLATASSPVASEPPWPQQTTSVSLDSSLNPQRKMRPPMLQQQHSQIASSHLSSRNNSTNIQELMQNLNELCYKGFDELNSLIQEQKWVQNYVNTNSSSPNPSSTNLLGSNCCSSRILIVPEYFIFKCKKVELTATHVFELLAMGRAELRLRDLLFVFKSWKELILNAELVHQEEENKLRLSTDHPQSYYMTDAVLQAAFDRVAYAIRQLCNLTQQARAAFQYATLNIFQTLSRQQQLQSQSQSQSTSIALAQLQALQQQNSSAIHRPTGSIRTTP